MYQKNIFSDKYITLEHTHKFLIAVLSREAV